MRRFITVAATTLLVLLAAQVALAQYQPVGTVGLSTTSPAAGASITVGGDGFAPASEVRITIESSPVLLATVTTNAGGAFSVEVTIPPGMSGTHQIVATGTDPEGSVRVLATTIQVRAAVGVPDTSAIDPDTTVRGSDALILAIAGFGIAILTAGLLLAMRRYGAR
jgi:titin